MNKLYKSILTTIAVALVPVGVDAGLARPVVVETDRHLSRLRPVDVAGRRIV